ncbi:O-antigen ligase family protein [Gryllotalpicola ginsengisoli]|uniref:O-antigen ligase family protein n=1 Tax=Gryllotalpicola ginsengisoli TaxID=444608 RepID=UPI0003B72048|nr:O-antigen ligase family protein [Gryllotalpicola ginsengisoli]
MTSAGRWRAFDEPLRALFESGRLSNALSLTIVGTAFTTFALLKLMGWPGLIGVLGTLVVLSVASFAAHRAAIEWQGLLPISLLVFVIWSALSTAWSSDPGTTLASALYQWSWAFLGIYLALVRDTIQVVRVVGDVLRFLLTLSLALEVLSGLLIDMPIAFLGIEGNIAHLGPIQGLFGSRNALALVSVIALVTFFVEWRTRSVTRGRAAYSLPLAVICLLLTRSPVAAVVIVVVVAAALALSLLRGVADERRRFSWQVTLAVASVVVGIVAWALRDPIIAALDAGHALNVRHALWIRMWDLTKVHPLIGWGWAGIWRDDQAPFVIADLLVGGEHQNGLNAYLDVLLQLGAAGLLLFGVLVVLALGRSWLIASNKRSVIHTWAPLVLIALLATSATESVTLVDYGWLLLVVCTVKASQNMSWRNALPHAPAGPALR